MSLKASPVESFRLCARRLHDTTLSYWKTERDAADHPRGTHSVAQCMVVVEGLKKGAFFTFRIVDQDQNVLARLSTKNEGDGRHWVSCLEVRPHRSPRGVLYFYAVAFPLGFMQLS